MGTAALLTAALPTFVTLALALSQHGLIGDIGFDIANGRWILAHGFVPLANHLSFAMSGAHWSNSEWLFGVYVAWLYGVGGHIAVYLGLLPLLLGLALLLAGAARRTGPYWQVILPLVAAVTIMPVMSPRPQLVSFVLFAYLFSALEAARHGRVQGLWAAALSTLVWVQVHGSVVLVPGLIALNLLLPSGELTRRRLAGPLVLSLLLLLVRPGGPLAVLRNLLDVGSGGNTSVISEWASPNFHLPWAMLAALVLFVSLPLVLPELAMRRRFADLVLLLGSAFALLYAQRFLPYFIIVALCMAAPLLPQRWRVAQPGEVPAAARRSLAIGLATGVALAVLLVSRPVFPLRSPMQAIGYLRRQHATDVFAAYQIGASLELYGVEPYLDSRDNLWLQRSWWPQFVAVTQGAMSVTSYLRRYDPGAEYVLWQVRSPVALELDQSPQWRRVLVDKNPLGPSPGTYGGYAVWRKAGAS